jgi:hypothetical protein
MSIMAIKKKVHNSDYVHYVHYGHYGNQKYSP